MNLVGTTAPDFSCDALLNGSAIVNNFTLSDYVKDKYALLFFYPLDFTFVCPTELLDLDSKYAEFKSRGCEVISVSVDSVNSHLAWCDTPVNKGGIGKVNYAMASDLGGDISRRYGVLAQEKPVSYRASILIDKSFKVRHAAINDLPLGRNVDELIRLLDALQHVEQYGEVCPAGWHKGMKAMKATQESTACYLADTFGK